LLRNKNCYSCKIILNKSECSQRAINELNQFDIKCLLNEIFADKNLIMHLNSCPNMKKEAECIGCRTHLQTLNQSTEIIDQMECEYCKTAFTRKEHKNHSRKECVSKIIRLYTEKIKSIESYYENLINSKEEEINILKKRIDFFEISKTNFKWNVSDLWKNPPITLTESSSGFNCVIQLKLSKDETTIVSGSDDNSIQVWNVENGSNLKTLTGHTDSVECVTQLKWSKDKQQS
jgi:WD40 repeat protein